MAADDWLKECNDQGVPLDDFKRQFCDRCLQPDCTRSIAGSSKFEQRVINWREVLFTDVPRMDPDHPDYARLSAQKFIDIDTGPIPEVGRAPVQSAWVDPRDLDAGPSNGQKEEVVVSEEQPQEHLSTEPSAPEEPAPVPEPASQPMNTPQQLRPMNTPRRTGIMLQGSEAATPTTPEKDPWAAPENPDTEGVEVVKPGSRFRFGGSGV